MKFRSSDGTKMVSPHLAVEYLEEVWKKKTQSSSRYCHWNKLAPVEMGLEDLKFSVHFFQMGKSIRNHEAYNCARHGVFWCYVWRVTLQYFSAQRRRKLKSLFDTQLVPLKQSSLLFWFSHLLCECRKCGMWNVINEIESIISVWMVWRRISSIYFVHFMVAGTIFLCRLEVLLIFCLRAKYLVNVNNSPM